MKIEDSSNIPKKSRRDIIKKAAVATAFILPSMTSVNVQELKAKASACFDPYPNAPVCPKKP